MKKKNNTIEEIWEAMKKSKNFLISLHPRPDGDSLGACAVLKYVLEKEGKKVTLISKDELSENLSSFYFTKDVDFGKGFDDYDLKDFDSIIFLDYGSLNDYPEKIRNKEFPSGLTTINIDHHYTNDYFGDLNYIDSNVVSCCSVLVDFFRKVNISFDKELSRRSIAWHFDRLWFFLKRQFS